MKKIVLKLLIITFIISAFLGISIIILDLWNDITSKILMSTLTIFGFSIPGLICSATYEKLNYKKLSMIGIITCFISCIYCLLLEWEIIPFIDEWELSLKIILTALLFSASFGYTCLLLLMKSNKKVVNYFRNGTICLLGILDILLLLMIYFEIKISWKIIAILGILIVLGTIITPLINKLSVEKINHYNKYDQLAQIKKLLDDDAITKEEYEEEKKKILSLDNY